MIIFLIIAFWVMALAALAGWVLAYKMGHEKGKFDAQLRFGPRTDALEAEMCRYRAIALRRAPWMLPPPDPPRQIRAKTGPLPSFTPRPAPPVRLEPSETGTFRKLSDTGEIRAIRDKGDAIVAGIHGGAA